MKKKIFILLAVVVAMAATNEQTQAQVKVPPGSSSQTLTQSLGIGTVTLTYNRPSMNGRKIFGGMEPYDKVWRTGANNIPIITFSNEVSIAGHKVQPGTYGILTIPGTNKWTVIFSKNSKQWGAYTYKQEEDLLRFDVTPVKLTTPVETFTMDFSNVTTNSAKLNLSWENALVSFDLKVDEDPIIMASIDEAMKGEKKPYFQAAQYYYKNGKDLKKAIEWVNEAEKENPTAPHIKYWKALMQLKAGDKVGAAKTARAGIEVATAAKNDEYIKLCTSVLEQAK